MIFKFYDRFPAPSGISPIKIDTAGNIVPSRALFRSHIATTLFQNPCLKPQHHLLEVQKKFSSRVLLSFKNQVQASPFLGEIIFFCNTLYVSGMNFAAIEQHSSKIHK